ncbi:MAG: hypothetical protein OXD42_02275 [Rhodospirillaceae bacterium]|nr:hypothetical protein [Rhodospirillaceae bacterium]
MISCTSSNWRRSLTDIRGNCPAACASASPSAFGALDAITRDELNLELERIWERSQKTVIFITHSIPEAVFLSDRVVVMSRNPGRIVEILDIEMARPRALDIRETPTFTGHVRHIRETFEGLGVMKRVR